MKIWTLIGLGLANIVLVSATLYITNKKLKEILNNMTTQEERLQAANASMQSSLNTIQSGVNAVKEQNAQVLAQLQDLRNNNPDLDDEVAAIEQSAQATQDLANSISGDVTPPVEETPPEETPPEELPSDGVEPGTVAEF